MLYITCRPGYYLFSKDMMLDSHKVGEGKELIMSFVTQRNWGTELLGNLIKITQVSGSTLNTVWSDGAPESVLYWVLPNWSLNHRHPWSWFHGRFWNSIKYFEPNKNVFVLVLPRYIFKFSLVSTCVFTFSLKLILWQYLTVIWAQKEPLLHL